MGRKYCIIKHCLTDPESKTESFHGLPSRIEDRTEWLEFISQCNAGIKYDITDGTFLCSKHFSPCCFSGTEALRRILKGHFPSQYGLKIIKTSKKSKCFHESPELTVEDLRAKLQETEAILIHTEKQLSDYKIKYEDAIGELKVLRQKLKRQEESKKRKLAEVSLEVQNFKRVKTASESNTPNDQASQGIRNLFIEILQRKTQSQRMKYPEILREFAFKLHYFSPRAYQFLRDELEKCLPHPRSFTRWLQFIITKPGLIEISLDFIRSRNSQSSHRLYYCLVLDEMNLRTQIILDNDTMKGYVNYGGFAIEVSRKDVAKTALFVLACEINGQKKIPIGYILTNGLPSNLMSAVLKKSLMAMDDVGAKVIAITFDGLKSNMTAVELLGANLKVDSQSFKPFIIHPSLGEKVFIILDPCHMMKLLRNTLKACGHFLDGNNNKIEWKFFAELVKLQEKSGLRAANKLTNRHIQFENQKMKVNLMAQTMSSSVKVAMDVCRLLNIAEFAGSEQTSYFIGLTDRLFDSMNSKPFGKGFKAPLRMSTKRFWKSLFAEAREYLLNLKIQNKCGNYVQLLKSKKGTCVRGLLICIESLSGIMEEIVAEDSHDLMYLPTYKLSQDSLELLFSTFRSRFGRNDNPNVVQLEHALKSVLCINLKPSLYGNCCDLDDSTTKISCLGSTANLCNQVVLSSHDEDNFDSEITMMPDFTTMSSFINNVVVYISGFVGRRLMKTLKCPSCITSLIPEDFESIKLRSDCILLNAKNNGGLFVPSTDLIQVCKVTELEIRRYQEKGVCDMDKKVIVNRVSKLCNVPTVFTKLRTTDSLEHPIFSDHTYKLIRSIADLYSKVRMNHVAKEATLKIVPETIRNSNTKAVHFSGN